MVMDFLLDDEEQGDKQPPSTSSAWKVLVVDDEPEVHDVTELVLNSYNFGGRPLELLRAYSGEEAKQLVAQHPDIALILLDVVMETPNAGLDVARYIRDDLKNRLVRIVLRTGQPGEVPEHEVITRYDINDYKHKTELTQSKLFTTVYSSLSAYRDLYALQCNLQGLMRILHATAAMVDHGEIEQFAEGVLEQLTALLYCSQDALLVYAGKAAGRPADAVLPVIASIGSLADIKGSVSLDNTGDPVSERIGEALSHRASQVGEDFFCGYFRAPDDNEYLLYLPLNEPVDEHNVNAIEFFISRIVDVYQKVTGAK